MGACGSTQSNPVEKEQIVPTDNQDDSEPQIDAVKVEAEPVHGEIEEIKPEKIIAKEDDGEKLNVAEEMKNEERRKPEDKLSDVLEENAVIVAEKAEPEVDVTEKVEPEVDVAEKVEPEVNDVDSEKENVVDSKDDIEKEESIKDENECVQSPVANDGEEPEIIVKEDDVECVLLSDCEMHSVSAVEVQLDSVEVLERVRSSVLDADNAIACVLDEPREITVLREFFTEKQALDLKDQLPEKLLDPKALETHLTKMKKLFFDRFQRDGEISDEGYKKFLKKVTKKESVVLRKEAHEIVQQFDLDGNGTLNFYEFMKMTLRKK